ncbi:hypothetical protein [Arcicella rigui]|uniref:Uncharacterized protein n=1 Tax=Arcicella rigui TaxID=797020 RepID=A0ABU5QAF6_9BACT|nr:hypothetical protein [Arcicella rigui]MEA5139829.1 hypothetical protein [Arcicella rigui]
MDIENLDFEKFVNTLFEASEFYERILQLDLEKDMIYTEVRECNSLNKSALVDKLKRLQLEVNQRKESSIFNYDVYPSTQFFIPTKKECEELKISSEKNISTLKKVFLKKIRMSIDSLSNVIKGELVLAYKNVTKELISFYLKGEFIPCSSIKKRNDILRDFENDIIWFGYIKYILEFKKDEINDDTNKNEVEDNSLNVEVNKYSIKAIALYYYFLIECGIEKPFDIRQGGKIKAMQEVSLLFRIDWGQFCKEYNKMNESGRNRMVYQRNRDKDYLCAIELLKKCPEKNIKAIIMAENEYKNLPSK